MAKRGIDEHPKTIEFAEQLGVPVCFAVGPLELFWHWVAKYHPNGQIGGTKPSAIAHAIRFPKTGQELVDALLAAGFLDGNGKSLIVHDWSEHADNAVHSLLKKRGERFADGHEPFTRNQIRSGKKEREEAEKDGSRTGDGKFTNGSPTPHEPAMDLDGLPYVRAQPEPVPEPVPEEEGAPAGPPGLVGVWAPLGDRLEDDRVVDRLRKIEANRAKAAPPLRPVQALDVQKVVGVLTTNRIGLDEFVAVLGVGVERQWKSVNCEAVARVCRDLRANAPGTCISESNPGNRVKPRSQWTAEERAAHDAELDRIAAEVQR